jgi:hypothetical protein
MRTKPPDMGFKHHPFYVDIMEYDGMYKQHYGSLWYFGSFEEKGVTFSVSTHQIVMFVGSLIYHQIWGTYFQINLILVSALVAKQHGSSMIR